MSGVGAYWSTDHMFGVPSRIVSKYALRARIAQLLDTSRRESEIKTVTILLCIDKSLNYIWESLYQHSTVAKCLSVWSSPSAQCLQLLWLPTTSSDSKLPIGVDFSVNSCLSENVCMCF